MAGLNKITLIGNLGRDPEVRYTPDGLAVTSFSLAVTEKYKGEERTLWFRVSAFGKLGEICGEYLSKGKQVYVEGRLHTSEWKDREGNTRFGLEVTASQMLMLGLKGDSAASGSAYDEPASSPAKARPSVSEKTAGTAMPEPRDPAPQEDDIPF